MALLRVQPKINGEYCKPFDFVKSVPGAARPPESPQPGLEAKRVGVALNASSFNAMGLTNETLLIRLFRGNFSDITIKSDNPNFYSLFTAYLGSYARACANDPQSRPKNFVEMTEPYCDDWRKTVTTHPNGMQTESLPYCAGNWIQKGTGNYVDPEMWAAKKKLDSVLYADAYKGILPVLKGDISQPLRDAATTVTAQKDMTALLNLNTCKSPGLARFQENMRLFATNKLFGIRLDGTSQQLAPNPASSSRSHDYGDFIHDLLMEEAKSWRVNKFLGGVSGVVVISSDAAGPTKIGARYNFLDGVFGGGSSGTVTLTFSDGVPECLYFWDAKGICRAVNRKIAAAFIEGYYLK